jgi:4-hydroxy-2-oxoheptanedioate aldolase
VLNGWLTIPSSWSAEVMAHQGWDSLLLDMQHGLMDYQTALTMLQAISTTDVTPLVRVPWNEPGIIGRMLDAGAQGVVCPMVNTRAEAEAFVGACRYAPLGYRSMGPTRAIVYAGGDYTTQANTSVLALAMIETREALDNVEAIASVPGLDGLYIGPNDLGQSLIGKGQSDTDDPVMLAAFDRIKAAATQNSIVSGIHTNSPEYAVRCVEQGFRFVTIMTDTRLLTLAASGAVNAVRGKTGSSRPTSFY